MTKDVWKVVIGLEVHIQINTHSKLFSSASTTFGAAPNSQVSLVDAAMPGMLPVMNAACIEKAVRAGLGLNARINKVSRFDRKNYFYPDLPQGYQISQLFHPIVENGYVDILDENGDKKTIGIERLHLEQDAGKSLHDAHSDYTCVDLNRAGVPLMEIVTRPELNNAFEVQQFLKKLRLILRYLDVSDCNMEEGSMRADVNISLCRPGSPLGTRAEIKNVNSFRFIGQAIEYEIKRQRHILEEGRLVEQETRLYDPNRQETRTMRSKEDALDYRYFPDPDLLPVIIKDEDIERIKAALPELPDDKHARFQKDYGLSIYESDVLVSEMGAGDFFEATVKKVEWPKSKEASSVVAKWIIGDLFSFLNKSGVPIQCSSVSEKAMAELVTLILDGTISGRLAKDVFALMCETGQMPRTIVEEKGLQQITDEGALEKAVAEVLSANEEMVDEYKKGKDKLFGFFVGQVMKKTQGKANPASVNALLRKILGGTGG